MNENLIILYDEDGNEVPFEFLDYLEYDHCNYVALLPLAGDLEHNAEVLILQVVEDEDGSQDFDVVEDRKLLDELYRQFREQHRDEFTFRD